MILLTLVSLLLLLPFGYAAPGGAGPVAPADSNVVDVLVRGLAFEAPDEVPSGWTTFRFKNASTMVHFALVERMPEGVGLEAQQEEVAPVFQEGMDLLNEGEAEAAMAAFGKLPAWYGEVVMMGGPGLVSPGHVGETTVYLEPGTYLIECYVKTNGVFHSYNPEPGVYGMVHEFTVTGEEGGTSPPEASLELKLSKERGIEGSRDLAAGRHTVAVHFADQAAHENFVGHDVHLARLSDDTDLDTLATWMDWTQPTGMETPAPVTFLGGLNEMPAGQTGYVTVTLEPGRYAWVAEVPRAGDKRMLQTFTVHGPQESGE